MLDPGHEVRSRLGSEPETSWGEGKGRGVGGEERCVCVCKGGRGGVKLRRNEPGHGYSANTRQFVGGCLTTKSLNF